MIILADIHLGASRRHPLQYNKFFSSFDYVLQKCEEMNESNIVIAGDLFDISCPEPYEYITVRNILRKHSTLSYYVIPGNHDLITTKNFCASEVIETPNFYVITKPQLLEIEHEPMYFVPFSGNIITDIKDCPFKDIILISHLSVIEANAYAGIASESDEIFNTYSLVIIGDSHMSYDHGKFHTIGTTFYCNVDEMLNNVSQCLKLTDHKLSRICFNELRIPIITSIEEAIDDNQIYVMESTTPSTKSNVYVKYRIDKLVESKIEDTTDSVPDIGTTSNKGELLEYCLQNINDTTIKKCIKSFVTGEVSSEQFIQSITSE
jgi:hypothetical protein